VGFLIREEMSGTHTFQDERASRGPLPFVFQVRWGPRSLVEWLNPLGPRFLWQEVKGRVRAEGLCDWVPCHGTLELNYGQARIRYAFDFDVEGQAYRFQGEKVNIRPWNLAVSHTTCYGTVVELESGKLISTSVTTFKLRHSLQFLASLRWQ
jgi:hypothetical protein